MPDPTDTKPPLTVMDIVAFKPPAALAGWKLTQDSAGGFSYRADINGVAYIAIPKQWEGRIMATASAIQPGTNFGLSLESLQNQGAGDSIRTNSGTFRPEGAESVAFNGAASTACPPSGPCPAPGGFAFDQFLLPAAIVAAALVYSLIGKRKA